MYFVYQSCQKLLTFGIFGMILPDVILYQKDNQRLREFILTEHKIQYLINLGNVFKKVTRPASILICKKRQEPQYLIKVLDIANLDNTQKKEAIKKFSLFKDISKKDISKIPGNLFVTENPEQYKFLLKLKKLRHENLGNLVDEDGIQRGVSPDYKSAFLVNNTQINEYQLEEAKLKKVLTGGKQVKRYFIENQNLWLIYLSRIDSFERYPNICGFINQFKDKITCKEVKNKKHPLYSLHRPRKEGIFLKDCKLIGVITGDRITIAQDNSQSFATDGLYLFSMRKNINSKFIMAILNSTLFVFLYRLLTMEKGRVLAQVKPTVLSALPIRTIDFSNSADRNQHENITELVDRMLELKKKLFKTKTGQEKNILQHQIDYTDKQIDKLVYKLYGLTKKEIAIIENDGI